MVFTRRFRIGSPFPVTHVVQQVRQWAVCACFKYVGGFRSVLVFFSPTSVCRSLFNLFPSWERKKKQKTAAVVDVLFKLWLKKMWKSCAWVFVPKVVLSFIYSKRSHFIWTTVTMRFYKSDYCSLQRSVREWMLYVRGLGTCQQLLMSKCTKNFSLFF